MRIVLLLLFFLSFCVFMPVSSYAATLNFGGTAEVVGALPPTVGIKKTYHTALDTQGVSVKDLDIVITYDPARLLIETTGAMSYPYTCTILTNTNVSGVITIKLRDCTPVITGANLEDGIFFDVTPLLAGSASINYSFTQSALNDSNIFNQSGGADVLSSVTNLTFSVLGANDSGALPNTSINDPLNKVVILLLGVFLVIVGARRRAYL